MKPWLLHPIPHGQWFLVVTDNGRHFYYNQRTGKSYWQLSDVFDTGVVKDEFMQCLDFDQVSILMAKARGLSIGDQKSQVKGREGEKEYSEQKVGNAGTKSLPQVEPADGDDSVNEINVEIPDDAFDAFHAKSNLEEAESPPHVQQDTESLVRDFLHDEGIKTKPTLLDEYGSDLDGDSSEASGHSSDSENSLHLDLTVRELAGDTEKFVEMLADYANKINKMDPWFLVSEDLAKDFAQDARFFSVTDDRLREHLYDEWVQRLLANTETENSPRPTQTQAFFNLLLKHKKAIKASPYLEFLLNYPEVASPSIEPKKQENLFRQFKVMLLDQEEYEKKHKRSPNYNSAINLKKQRLEQFLRESRVVKKPVDTTSITGTEFEKWIILCHKAEIPEKIRNSPYNFVVGDEKRWEVYQLWAK